nr:hypothetical protein [Tanacetum cinerariifolium]
MINSIKNGDQPLPRVTQVSIAETSSTEQPPLKDKSMWSYQEKKIQKIDHLARSLLIQGLPNDIYSLIDNNKTAKDLWDALARHMFGSEYDEQDRKLQFCMKWKQYATMMRQHKNLLNINIDALYNILKQNQCDVNDAMKSKKKAVVITSYPLALVVEQTKIIALLAKAFNRKKFYSKPTNNNLRTSSDTSSANKKQEHVKYDDKIAEVSYYTSKSESESEYETSDYYDNSTTYGLFVDNNDDQEIFHDSNVAKIINQMIKEFDKKIAKNHKRLEKANQQSKDFKNQTKFLQEKCDVLQNQTNTFEVKNNELNEQIKVLIENNDDLLPQTKALQEQLKVKHVVIDNHVECQAKYAKLEAERYEYMIRYSAYFDNNKQHRKQIADQEILFDKMIRQLVEFDKNVRMLKNTVLEKDMKISKLKECVRNKNLEIEKCLERLNECENKPHKIGF